VDELDVGVEARDEMICFVDVFIWISKHV